MTFHAYMLKCADGSYYVGYTDELEQQVAQHEAGAVPGYTAQRLPVSFIWSAEFASNEEALGAALQIKRWSRAKKEALISGDHENLPQLGRKAPSKRAGAKPRASTAAPQPVIVLVRPQLGENIGKAARAMLNFGLTQLRLVSPRDGWPNPDAGPAASGADEVLAQAQVFETLAEAVADCSHVFATTVRKRGVTKPVMTPDEAARTIHAEPGQCAIVFGPERSGLETDDVALARTILTVPVNPEFGSLNLAQAVVLTAYEWSKQTALEQPPLTELLPPAPQEELEGMIEQLEVMLAESGYYFPPGRARATRLTLRTLLTKPGWNHLEVRTLRGVLTSLARPRRP